MGISTALQLADSNISMIRKSFDVIVERTVRELNGESCLALEDAPPPKQQIVVSRSFGQRVTSIEDLQQAVVTYATRASEKLREQGSKCQHVSVAVNTGRYGNEPQYANSAAITSEYPTSDTRDIIGLALRALDAIGVRLENGNYPTLRLYFVQQWRRMRDQQFINRDSFLLKRLNGSFYINRIPECYRRRM